MESSDIKEMVKEKYTQIVTKPINTSACCSGSGCCGSTELSGISMIGEEYNTLEGHLPEADYGLGCGIPTEFAGIKEGNTVLDLGSGAGNDVFVARSFTGNSGKVIGVDMTEAMIEKANINLLKSGYNNIEFRLGEIESLPVEDNSIDVVISNCVLNLVPDKVKAFSEVFRVLKPGGHFCISDVVLKGELPDEFAESAAMYAGCISGALKQEEYLEIISKSGFSNIKIRKSKNIEVPEEIKSKYLSAERKNKIEESGFGIFSITVTAEK